MTRSFVSMERQADWIAGDLCHRQCAYSASFYLRFSKSRKLSPAAVVGVPVGFVNVVESKERLIELGVPAIVAKGRKGGSNIAAAIINAIQYKIEE